MGLAANDLEAASIRWDQAAGHEPRRSSFTLLVFFSVGGVVPHFADSRFAQDQALAGQFVMPLTCRIEGLNIVCAMNKTCEVQMCEARGAIRDVRGARCEVVTGDRWQVGINQVSYWPRNSPKWGY